MNEIRRSIHTHRSQRAWKQYKRIAHTHTQMASTETIERGTSVFLRSKRVRSIVRRPGRAKSDCIYNRRQRSSPHSRQAGVTRRGLIAGALGPSIVSLNTNKSPPPPPLSSADVAERGAASIVAHGVCVCVYYCTTFDKAVRVGGGGEWRTCATRDDEPRPVWTRLPITH